MKIEIKSQIFRKDTFVDLSENITGFYGKSGCGKTMLIKEIANHLNVKINNYSIGEEKSITQNDLDIINDYIWYLDCEIISVSFNNNGSLDVLHRLKNDIILPFEQESSGTQKMILMLPTLVKALQNGTIFIIDDIETHLHPEIVKFIITMFDNPEYNNKNAKLIFTSHSVNIFDYLNKENIVIIRKNDGGSYLIELKSDAEYCKDTVSNDFLEGIYGSSPNIKEEHFKSKLEQEFLDGSLGSFPLIAKISFLDKLTEN
jgi:predicted ATP-binding protein involved in virulence